jgi:hypothetical protein
MVNWYKETEGPILNIYFIKQKYEVPFQMTDISTASISANGQGVAEVAYRNVF